MPSSDLKAIALDVVLPCFLALAQDVTPSIVQGTSLVFAPHEDDDILSCGASIARARQAGQAVKAIFVTDGSASSVSTKISPGELAARRRIEAVEALEVLGCHKEDVFFLDVPDSTTSSHIEAVANSLMTFVERFQPAQIFSPYVVDPHPDHVAVALAVDSLVRRSAIHCRVFEYPRFQVKSAATHLLNPAIWRRLRRSQAQDLLPLKRAALAKHRSQCENLTGEESWQTLPQPWMKMFFQSSELFIEKIVSKAVIPPVSQVSTASQAVPTGVL